MTWTLPWQNRQDTDSSSFSSSFSLNAIARPLIVFHVPSADGVVELNWLSSSGSSSWILERLALAATVAFSLFSANFAAHCLSNSLFDFFFALNFDDENGHDLFFFLAAFSPKQTLNIHGEY